MFRLQGFFHNGHDLGLQVVQVHLFAQSCPEGCHDLLGVVLLTVEAPVDVMLDAAAEGSEKGGDEQGREDGDYRRLLTADGSYERLEQHHAAKIDDGQCKGQGAVNQGAADDDVDVEQAILKDSKAVATGTVINTRVKNKSSNLELIG